MAFPTCAGWPAQRGGVTVGLGSCAAGAEVIESPFHPIQERVERASVLSSVHRPGPSKNCAIWVRREQDLSEHGLHRHERRESIGLAAGASARCGGAKPQPNQSATADRVAL
jgi:hypothetical protein